MTALTKQAWLDHHGHNPAHRWEGRERGITKVPHPAGGLPIEMVWRGPRNPSRWLPHQGTQEAARRYRRMEARR